MLTLRPFDDPQFAVIGEVVDFATQIILEVRRVPEVSLTFNYEQGLTFMHSHDIAHGYVRLGSRQVNRQNRINKDQRLHRREYHDGRSF